MSVRYSLAIKGSGVVATTVLRSQRVICLLALSALALGCQPSSTPRQPTNEAPFDLDLDVPGNLERAYDEIGRLYQAAPDTQAEVNALAATFGRYPEFTQSLREASTITLYQGTPIDGEAAAADVVSFDGFEFWKDLVEPNLEQARTLQNLFSRSSTVYPFRGFSNCIDGFHPDWRLGWTHDSDDWNAYLCFGCNEMQIFRNGERVIYCCLRDIDALKAALNE